VEAKFFPGTEAIASKVAEVMKACAAGNSGCGGVKRNHAHAGSMNLSI